MMISKDSNKFTVNPLPVSLDLKLCTINFVVIIIIVLLLLLCLNVGWLGILLISGTFLSV